jgi:hypothetical protein
LVGWPVFAHADGVVRCDVDCLEALEGAHADSCCCVLLKFRTLVYMVPVS